MWTGFAKLRGGRLGCDHCIEVLREPDRGLAVARRDVYRELPARRIGCEPLEESRGVLGPVPLVLAGLPGKVILEIGRRRHVAIVAGHKKAPGFWPGAEVRTFGEGKEVR